MSRPAASPPPQAQTGATRLVWLGLACTVLLDSVGQLLWKRVAAALPDSDNPLALLLAAAADPLAWLMAALLLIQLLLWLAVLRRSELSFAQPLTSLSYVGVSLLSFLWLGEALRPRTLLSVALILGGVALISGRRPPGVRPPPGAAAP